MRTWRITQRATVAAVALLSAWIGQARGDFFGTPPTKVPNVNAGNNTIGGCISADGLSFYVASDRPGGYGGMFDMYVATRASTQDEWGPAVNLGPTLNSAGWEHTANISPDGLSLYFSSDRPGGSGALDIWVATRPDKDSPWGKPVNLGPAVNSSAPDFSARESADGLTLLFHSTRGGGLGGEDIWMSTRATKNDPWGKAVNPGAPVNSTASDDEAVMTADGLRLFFSSDRAGAIGDIDLWVTTRRTTSDPWGPPLHLGRSVNTPYTEWTGSISADGSTLYFGSDRAKTGMCSVYQTTIGPVVDFNGDGKVDEADIRALVDNWGKDDPLYDMGPTPFGDGVVDMQDMAVLTRYAAGKLVDPTLVACWEFDETEGIAVCNTTDTYAASLMGNPIWRPQGGAVGGAIELDGVDDCVVVTAQSELPKGPLSVLVWVKGGKPGQVIFSQQAAANWLVASAPTGALGTELRGPVRGSGPLSSQAVITDGRWHRVGLVWDGKYRRLYVDSVLVAEDVQENLRILYANLTIGAGKDMAPGTFWSGLIDDVRIYNRVVKP